MQIIPFLPHYQSVCTNFDFSSFSLISCTVKQTLLPCKRACFALRKHIAAITSIISMCYKNNATAFLRNNFYKATIQNRPSESAQIGSKKPILVLYLPLKWYSATTVPCLAQIRKKIENRYCNGSKSKEFESKIREFGVGQCKEVGNKGCRRCDDDAKKGIEMLRLQT